MIDRNARDRLASNLRGLISGKISNDDFEAAEERSEDGAIAAVSDSAWLLYSDMKEHKLTADRRLNPDVKREVVRWILFLDSNFQYVWPSISTPAVDPLTRVKPFWRRLLEPGFLSRETAERFLASGDYDAWPFGSRGEYKKALKGPRRLARKAA